MLHFDATAIGAMDKIYRLNLINSVTGYKSAHLIGTRSETGATNLAIFSSVIHLGSNPPLIGFILRPTTVPRHTYQNLKATGIFTLNAITKNQIADAHHTSAKYPQEISEFDQTQLEAEFKPNCSAPFVKGAPIQMACRFENEYHIKENDTLLLVGAVQHLYVANTMVGEDGWVTLEKENVVAINGLDGYALPQLLERFAYARPNPQNK
jgi:flavin reductase (DIM6/NTAB) family NADH-FMN oxidoreductase RutF